MNIRPFGRQIYFLPHKEKNPLLLSNEVLADTGDVLSIGPCVSNIKIGDKIAFNRYGAQQVEIDGKMCHFVLENDDVIICVYEN